MDSQLLASLTAKYPMRILQNGNIRTSPVRLSYANGLFKPRAVKEGDPKRYTVSLLFPVGADLSILYGMANKAAVDKFGDPSKHKLKSPFLKQDDVPDPGYMDGGVYLRCGAPEENQPQVIDLQGRRLLSETDCYSGAWAIATIRAFAYDAKLNKGVSFGVQNILKIADDDRFSGRSSADEDFADVLDAAPAADAGQAAGQFFR
jgi:hypothetical protein